MALTALSRSLQDDRVDALGLREVCNVAPGDSIRNVIQCMVEHHSGCALVMEGPRLVGIFTEHDFVNRVVARGIDVDRAVQDVMTPNPKTIPQDASVLAAAELMEAGGYRHLPVMGANSQPIGVVLVKDIVHYLVEHFPGKVYNLPPTPGVRKPAREGA